MTHEDATREMAIERYLLQELPEALQTEFEEHLFECALCAADLSAGQMMLEAGKKVAKQQAVPTTISAPGPAARATAPARVRKSPLSLLEPWLLIPALAASLLLLIYQSTLVLPGLRRQLARAEAPEVLNSVVLANMNVRGSGLPDDKLPEITAPADGSFLVSVDIPARSGVAGYMCLLYGPSGSLLWEIPVTPQRAENAVSLRVPTQKSKEGVNELLVQAIAADPAGGAVDLGRYRFRLKIER